MIAPRLSCARGTEIPARYFRLALSIVKEEGEPLAA